MISTPSDYEGHGSDHNLENEDEDHDLFPSSDRPSTPKNNHLNATAPGELSPPQSQSTSQQAGVVTNDTVEMSGMVEEAYFASHNMNGMDGTGETNEQLNGGRYIPGMGWKTKKANDEYQRAAETLVDRDFSLREFGDLFDDRAVVP